MKPILMNTEMVKATLARRKTVTRRIAFPNNDLREIDCAGYPNGWWFRGRVYKNWQDAQRDILRLCKYKVADVLYVRETWCKGSLNGGAEHYFYRADDNEFCCKWRPSIHMPKEAARIFLRVTGVRVERLKDITVEQAEKEGFPAFGIEDNIPWNPAILKFKEIWDSTIKKADLAQYGWEASPWVFVIEFERISKEEALKSDK